MLKQDGQPQAGGVIDEFMRWWGNQLLGLIPDKFRNLLTRDHSYLLIALDADTVRLWEMRDGSSQSLGRFSNNETDKVALQQILAQPEREQCKIVLMLFAQQLLRKQFKLPAAAMENLRQVVGFEMDRWTPFKADQVYYDVRVVEQLKDVKKVTLELVLTPKERLDNILMDLQEWELEPERVDVAQTDHYEPMYNLLPENLRVKGNQIPYFLSLFLGLCLVGMLVAALLLPLWRERSLAIEAIDRVEVASQQAQEVQQLKQESEQVSRGLHFLLEKRKHQPVLTDVLDELSLRLPDTTWLTNLTYKQKNLQIQGQSPSASGLIEIIEESPLFSNTRFVSPVTEDRMTKQERFQIATEVAYRIQHSVRSAE